MSSAKIKKALKDSDLSRAFTLLESRLNEIGNYDLKNLFDEAMITYRAMLTYLLQGFADSEYSKRREELTRTLFSINDQADRIERILTADKQSRYVSAHKFAQTSSLENIQQRLEITLSSEEHEEETCKLFNYVWTCGVWNKGDYETATNILTSETIENNDKAVFISAVTLSLMELFDVRKIHLLFDAYLNPEGIVNQRALVGIILIIRMYDSRLECFPEIQARLDTYSEDQHFIKDMFAALLMLQFSSITDKITNKMQNDLLPMIMKKHDGIRKMSEEEIRAKLTANGENPDWVDKKMEKSIREIGDLQIEGADIYMSTFRYMKGYSFFNKLPHWFYPFNKDSHLISDKVKGQKGMMGNFIKIVTNNGIFCDNDLYSFYFMMNTVNGNEKDIIQGTVSDEITQEDLQTLSDDSVKNTHSNKVYCRNYIFNLYRFFECYPFYNQFDNPFKMRRKNADGTERLVSFSPLETKTLSFLSKERGELQSLAEFFMRKGFYDEALEMYKVIDPKEIEEDANLWQKIGFCKQKLGKEKSAYKTYLLADSLLPDSRWTMIHIAQLAQKLEIYDTAINYYDMLLMQNAENLKFVVNKAICQMKSNLYDDALTTLFKANYLDEESVDIRSMMIECYVLTNQLDKANEMIASLITNESCGIEIRILNALLTMKTKSLESAYYCVREAISFFEDQANDGHSFTYYYNKVIKKYSSNLGIEPDIALMILDSVNLDIR